MRKFYLHTTVHVYLLKQIFNLIENGDCKGVYPILYTALFSSKKVPLRQVKLFARLMVSILYLKVNANLNSKDFEMEISMLMILNELRCGRFQKMKDENLETLLVKNATELKKPELAKAACH